MLHELHAGRAVGLENLSLLERIILPTGPVPASPHCRRWQTSMSSSNMLADEVEGEQRMAQIVEHAEERDQIEAFLQTFYLIHRHLPEFRLGGPSLPPPMPPGCDSADRNQSPQPDPRPRASFRNSKTGIAANIEHRAAVQVHGQRMCEAGSWPCSSQESAGFERGLGEWVVHG
jgi:hypothetical protein